MVVTAAWYQWWYWLLEIVLMGSVLGKFIAHSLGKEENNQSQIKEVVCFLFFLIWEDFVAEYVWQTGPASSKALCVWQLKIGMI